ncbi:hypothetical protein CPB85DRAFT_114120 [Mucidula mucida]|nr:hypothetical protein CPB85DRAFT_114120 [Mucidula mucida]
MYVQEITVPRHAHHLTKFCFNLSPNCLPATITRMAHTILPLPGPPSHTRPPLQLWGSGLNNFGQLGMGENVSDTNDKLKRNLWAEENLTSNLFGSKLSRQEEHIFFSSMKMVWVSGSNDDAAFNPVARAKLASSGVKSQSDVESMVPRPKESSSMRKSNSCRLIGARAHASFPVDAPGTEWRFPQPAFCMPKAKRTAGSLVCTLMWRMQNRHGWLYILVAR